MDLDTSKWSLKEIVELLNLLVLACILAYFIVRFLSNLQAAWSKRKPGDGPLDVLKIIQEERDLYASKPEK
ncbi:hypothetical protein [Azohydromonas caseinilytica]|uniref:Uncharacterized protein n=1 Tax=Azohydromonas caseinilytica TaxID=2728836 RepID=A0A848FA30_9BURK|nr:hypothetical protein [Azohydromonas caseinilytica]NML17027.1 hypothetical protein [Azohydromonas caseinilytica]